MSSVLVRDLGVTAYEPVFEAMRAFTHSRNERTDDEIWLTEHEPVFTQGQAGKPEHVLVPGDIPVVQSDRGGQVTYHGPGQITAYLLFDLRRMRIGVRDLVTGIEESMRLTVQHFGISGAARADAPGLYVEGRKIGSLGLRVRKGCSYHGLSLNVDMELEPFSRINPCGLLGMEVTHIRAFTNDVDMSTAKSVLLQNLVEVYELTPHTPDSSLAALA